MCPRAVPSHFSKWRRTRVPVPNGSVASGVAHANLMCVCVCRPNVCVRTTESFDIRDDDDDDEDDDNNNVIHYHHHFAMSTVCDDSNNVYQCTITYVYTSRVDTGLSDVSVISSYI